MAIIWDPQCVIKNKHYSMSRNCKSLATTESSTASSQPPEDQEESVGESFASRLSTQNCLCPLCETNQNPECPLCKGKGNLDNSNHFRKFVDAILDYKMGRSKAVIEQLLDKKRQSYTTESTYNYCYSSCLQMTSEQQKYLNYSCANRASLPIKLSSKLSQQPPVHQGIQCDQCHQWPIIGIRYKCQQCQDYDLCSRCLEEGKHEHINFQVIHQPKRNYQKQKLRESLHHEVGNDCLRLNSIIHKVSGKITTIFS